MIEEATVPSFEFSSSGLGARELEEPSIKFAETIMEFSLPLAIEVLSEGLTAPILKANAQGMDFRKQAGPSVEIIAPTFEVSTPVCCGCFPITLCTCALEDSQICSPTEGRDLDTSLPAVQYCVGTYG